MAAEASYNEAKSVSLELVDDAPRRSKCGRPAVLTKRVFIKICHLVESGFATSRACEIEQVSYRIFRQRVAASVRLTERLKKATDTRFELRHEQALESVMAAGERSWMAHAWWLERCLPHLYALRNVSRPDPSDEQTEPELPSEVLAHHQQLLLEKAREDQQRAKSAQVEPAA